MLYLLDAVRTQLKNLKLRAPIQNRLNMSDEVVGIPQTAQLRKRMHVFHFFDHVEGQVQVSSINYVSHLCGNLKRRV